MVGGSTGGGGYSGGGGGGYYDDYGGGSELSDEEKELAAAQKELLELQTSILKEQQATLKSLMPFIAEQSGYELEIDANGNVTGAKPSSSPDAVKRRELESGFLDQSLKALRGELDVSPSLNRALDRQEEQLNERLAQQFGPGYETSSAGIETLQEFETSSEGLREDVRRGLLTSSEQLGQARGAEGLGRLGGVTNTVLGAPLNIAQLFGGIQQGYAAAQAPFTQSRIAQMNADTQFGIAQMQANTAQQGQQANMMGSLLPFLMGGFSDERMKADIKPTGLTLGDVFGTTEGGSDIAIEEWRYKTDPKGTKRYGPMAQDIEKHYPGSVGEDEKGRKYVRGDSLIMNLTREKNKSMGQPRGGDALRGMTLREALGRGA